MPGDFEPVDVRPIVPSKSGVGVATLAEDSIPGLGSPGSGGGTSAVLGEPFGRARAPSATVRTDGEITQTDSFLRYGRSRRNENYN